MATMRNRTKVTAVLRETLENTMNSQSQNTRNPGTAQEYISQFSQEIECRVTKKLSKEFSRMESRISVPLSKLDEFLLNPQVRTCSIAVPGTSSNSNSGNREPNGDRFPSHPCPQPMISHHSGNLVNSETEEYPHMATGGPEQKRFTIALT